ncbi:MAG: peptidoglycan editing factor PgeF [Clostridiales bacterium]|nr:peptidoglycan editing factor PgeF [Clostridiales bacterium]
MFKLNHKGAVAYYTISSFEETGLVNHCISTREGGVSGGCYSSMNLRFNCDDAKENVLENFRRIADAAGMESDRLVLPKQVHEDNIHTIEDSDIGNGIVFENKFVSADGLITDKKGAGLVTLYADCVPLMFLDRRRAVIATSHSGWKGTVKCIGAKTVRKMMSDYGSRPEDILCAIGPSIQVDHFEVGDDVAQIFIDKFGSDTAVRYGDRYHVDMQRAIIKQLTGAGIPAENIDNCGICTYCKSELLFSHRKTNGRRGNFGAFIELRSDIK